MTNEIYLTKERLDELKNELHELKTKRRQEVAERLKRAKELGDLSENSEYFEAREEQADIENRIFELEETVKRASIIKKSAGGGTIKIGSTVIAKKDGKEIKYSIVGYNEARPEEGRVSNESPIGKAFLGKSAGESATVETPKGKIIYKITAVE